HSLDVVRAVFSFPYALAAIVYSADTAPRSTLQVLIFVDASLNARTTHCEIDQYWRLSAAVEVPGKQGVRCALIAVVAASPCVASALAQGSGSINFDAIHTLFLRAPTISVVTTTDRISLPYTVSTPFRARRLRSSSTLRCCAAFTGRRGFMFHK